MVGCQWLPAAPPQLCHALLCRSQHEEKEKAFKEQLAHLASLLPTLQVGLGRAATAPGVAAVPAVTPPAHRSTW